MAHLWIVEEQASPDAPWTVVGIGRDDYTECVAWGTHREARKDMKIIRENDSDPRKLRVAKYVREEEA